MKLARGDKALNAIQLKVWAAKCDTNAGNTSVDPEVAQLEAHARRSESESLSLVEVVDARHKGIPTRRDSQVVVEKRNSSFGTTMNVVCDFYGNRILLGQAPLTNRMVEFWSAMMQEYVSAFLIFSFTSLIFLKF